MAELTPEVKPGTLVVFDIDNTLLEPVGNIGSDQWYYYLLKAYKRDGNLSDAEAEDRAAKAWTSTLGKVKVRPVEALTPPLVAALQRNGIQVMALTARGTEDEGATMGQLKDIGVDLGANTVTTKRLAFKKGKLADAEQLFSGGVFFASEAADKGKVLAAFMKKLKLKPSKVVFADDKPHHTKNVDAALTAAGIPVVALRYGAADAKVRAFNEVMAEADTPGSAELLFHGPK